MKKPAIITNQLILIVILFALTFTFQSCEQKEKKTELSKKELELKDKQIVIDSVSSNVQEKSNSQSISKTENNTAEIPEARLSGKHSLTIQWISWTKPGEITFNSIGNNKYEVEGFQKGNKSDKCPECS